jgi:hypothetical protein
MGNVTAWLKSHKGIVLGGLLGVVLFYYIFKHAAAASGSAAPTDLSGGGQQVQALTAAASLQNAQVNGQVEVAQLQSSVASAQVAASLQADLAKTAAELSATNEQTAASVAITSINDSTMVELQRIVSNADVQKVAIEGRTYTALGAQHASTADLMIRTVGAQIKQIQDHSKHASQDYREIAPLIALETGQGFAAGPVADAAAKHAVGQANAEAGAASSIFSSIMNGFFGK